MARFQRFFRRSTSPIDRATEHEIIQYAKDSDGRLWVIDNENNEHRIAYDDDDPGGLAAPRGQYMGNPGDPVTVANGGMEYLTWDNKNSGETLLDISDPQAGLVLEDGIYVVSAEAWTDSPISSGGYFHLQIVCIGEDTNSAVAMAVVPWFILADGIPPTATTVPIKMSAGNPIYAQLLNRDGSSARDFYLFEAFVTKLG